MDIRLALMCGIDIPIEELQTVIHQPTVKEIAYVGEEDFFTGIQTLTISKEKISFSDDNNEMDKSILSAANNFQIFMAIMSEQEAVDKKQAVKNALQLFFPDKNVAFTPRSLIFSGGDAGQFLIDEDNFQILQDKINEICCLKNKDEEQQTLNPVDEKAKRIAQDIMRARKRVAAQKASTQKGSILGQYLSILTVGLKNTSLQEMMNLTMYQVYDLVERFSLYTKWDIDIRSRLAGADIKEKPVDWMKNIH